MVGASAKNGARGAAYVFVRSGGGTWTQQQKLLPNDAAASDTFGSAVAISANGGTAIVGAQGKNNQTGAAYVFAGAAQPGPSSRSSPPTTGRRMTTSAMRRR